MALIAKGDPGIDREIVIDGIVLSVMPGTLDVTHPSIGDYQNMLDGGGRRAVRRPHFDGIANRMDRYTINVPLESLKGDNLVKMEEIVAAEDPHRVVLWRMTPFIYTLKAGLTRYYLPRLRKCAAWVYDGLMVGGGVEVNTTNFPSEATYDGDELAVTYAEGPTLADPGAGGLVIARHPDSSGAATDFTAFRIGDVPTGGEIIKLWLAPAMEMSLDGPQIGVSYKKESHAYTFVEL